MKWLNFKSFWGQERQGDKFYHLCLNSPRLPLFSSNLNSTLLSNRTTWENREMVWKDAESIFRWRFHGRRRCRIVRSLYMLRFNFVLVSIFFLLFLGMVMCDNNMIMSLKQKKRKFEPRLKLNHNICTSCRSGWPRGFSCINPSPYSWIFTSVSVGSIHFRYGPGEYPFTPYSKVWHRTYPTICDAPLSRSARRSFSPLQESRRNHRSYVRTKPYPPVYSVNITLRCSSMFDL